MFVFVENIVRKKQNGRNEKWPETMFFVHNYLSLQNLQTFIFSSLYQKET
jgi:hypothetical protein